MMLRRAREKKLFQSIHLLTLSITNQNALNTIENEEKGSANRIRKQILNHRPFAVEKNNSHKELVLHVIFRFSRFLHFRQ